jgi:hypothetical protein
MIHKAKNLTPDEKLLIEHLLGRQVLEEEAISVRAFEPPALSEEQRQEVAQQLKRYFAELDKNREPDSADRAEEVINEAIRTSRPGFHSRR